MTTNRIISGDESNQRNGSGGASAAWVSESSGPPTLLPLRRSELWSDKTLWDGQGRRVRENTGASEWATTQTNPRSRDRGSLAATSKFTRSGWLPLPHLSLLAVRLIAPRSRATPSFAPIPVAQIDLKLTWCV